MDAATQPKFHSTKKVAEFLGIRPSTLSKAVSDGRVGEPPKFCGCRAWTLDCIENASWSFRHKPLSEAETEALS